ncbi:MAG TPA: hypothetical protein VGD60_04545 [Candidatus Acidoferrales bacterium]
MTDLKFDKRGLLVGGRLCRIARLDADDYKFLEDPEPVIAALRESDMRIDLFTFIQKLPENLLETSRRLPYPFEMDNMAVLPVTTFENWWSKQIGFKARNKAKQAEKKGLSIREVAFDENLSRGIWEIYNEVPVRQGRRFPHFGKTLEKVHAMSSTYLDTSVYIGAFDGEKLAGFIKLTIDDTGTQAGMMHIISAIQYRDKAPTNALVAQAVRSCADRGIRYLVYSQFAYGKKLTSTLSEFKERNGFARVDIPRYYVPLTAWGSMALSMRLHHRLADRLPAKFAENLRDLRSKWYQKKFELKPDSL